MRSLVAAAVLAGATMVSSTAGAVTFGDTVTCTNPVGTTLKCSAASAVVGSGSEFTLYHTLGRVGSFTDFTFDFSDNALTITSGPSYSIGSTQPVYFSIGDPTHPFTNVTLLSATGHLDDGTTLNPALTQSDFVIDNGVLKFNLVGSSSVQYSNATIRLDLSPAVAAAVPEPAAWALMIFGIGSAGVALRRRRAQPTVAPVAA